MRKNIKMKGKVKFFNEGKGFGFIKGDDGNEYFVHISGLNQGVRLADEVPVTFDVEDGERGPKAVNVSLDEYNESSDSNEEENSNDEE